MMTILFVFLFVGATAYVWCTRGFFSALLHMVCVIAAGAVAFGVWEPVAYFLIGGLPERGFGSALTEMAWGLALALPFAITLALLRAAVDQLVPFNAHLEGPANYIGGGVCGVISGVISAGIALISINFLRLEPEFLGYQSVGYAQAGGRGSIERVGGSMIPWVDRITSDLYSRLSLTTMRTSEPLARWHPEFDTLPGSMRLTYDGRDRITTRPDSFSLVYWYTVGDPQKPQKFDALLGDKWQEAPQKVSDLKGNMFGSGEDLQTGYLAGFMLRFNSKAREKTGQVSIGNGQIRLVAVSDDSDDDSLALHPIAVITNIEDPTKTAYSRFRFAADGTFVSSVGGSSEAKMAFEFPVPAHYHPLALYVKGVRVDLTDKEKPLKVYGDPNDRDSDIDGGTMQEMTDVGPNIDPNTGKPVVAQQGPAIEENPIVVGNSLGSGIVIQKGTEQGLNVTQNARGWSIESGECALSVKAMKNNGGAGMDPKLKIDRFAADETTAVVKMLVTPARMPNDFNKAYEAADRNAEPALVDINGNRYPVVGWIYKDSTAVRIRYDRGTPITKLNDVPAVSRSSTDRELTLIFVVSAGVEISDFKIGDTALFTPKKPIKADAASRR